MKDEQIVFKNLRELTDLWAKNRERMLFALSELSHLVAADIRRGKISLHAPYDFADGVRHLFSEELSFPEDTYAEYLPFLKAELDHTHFTAIAAFARFLAQMTEDVSFEPITFAKVPVPIRAAYVPSPMAQIAFDRLSQHLTDTAVLYVGGADEACSAVLASHADIALLPLTGENGERVAAMERLTEKYHMALVLSVRIYPDGENETAYGVFAPIPLALNVTELTETEIRFTAESFSRVADIISALSPLGFSIVRQTFAPAEYGGIAVRVTMSGEGGIKALWFFLSLATAGFEILGSYSSI